MPAAYISQKDLETIDNALHILRTGHRPPASRLQEFQQLEKPILVDLNEIVATGAVKLVAKRVEDARRLVGDNFPAVRRVIGELMDFERSWILFPIYKRHVRKTLSAYSIDELIEARDEIEKAFRKAERSDG